MTQRVLFRADSGGGIGSGHLVRCLALAREFSRRGAQVSFVCLDRPGALLDLPRQADYAMHVLPGPVISWEADAAATAKIALQWSADLVVADQYGLDARWETGLRSTAGRLLALDDLADRPHACDWLLDQNDCWPAARRYSALLPAGCRQMLGPQFALVRPEFVAARKRVAPRDGRIRRMVVFMSGSDDTNETAKALHGLALLGDRGWHIDVVIGAAHPDAAGIVTLCEANGWHAHQQIDNMADLLARADLCLGSAGTASWERCVLGVPALVVELAQNQRTVIAALERQGCVKSLGDARYTRAEDYADALSGLRADDLVTMSQAAWQWVDGEGARRVADVVHATTSEA